MRIYIATPITGVPAMNRPMVDKIAGTLLEKGHVPVIPHDVDAFSHDGPCPEQESYPGLTITGENGQPHGGLCYLRADLVAMLQCDAVIMAPGWSRSRGANVEYRTARSVGLPVLFWREWLIPSLSHIGSDPEPQDAQHHALVERALARASAIGPNQEM